MEHLLPILYKSYGTYVNQEKMLPSIVDGLIPVQRRLLLTCHQVAKKWKKTAAILGECMARYHPHSEAIGTAENMIHNGFIDGNGSWGTRVGIEPTSCAAMRYTKMKSNSKIEEIAFKYIKHVQWVEGELDDKEPIAIPTMLPFCLMQKYETSLIAFGYRTNIPCYKATDLVKRLLYLLGQGDEIQIVPQIIHCDVLSGDFNKLLSLGRGKLDIKGHMQCDNKSNTVEVMGWSPRVGNFQSILNKIDKYKKWKLLTLGDVGFIDQTGKGGSTRIVFEVLKQRNIKTIYNKLVEAISESLKTSISYSLFVCEENGTTKLVGVDEMLLKTFNHYKQTVEEFTKASIQKLTLQIDEYNIVKLIRPYISESIAVSNNDPDVAADYLATKTGVDVDKIKAVIEKYRIKKLMSIQTDTTDINNKINDLNTQLSNIHIVCVQHYNNLI